VEGPTAARSGIQQGDSAEVTSQALTGMGDYRIFEDFLEDILGDAWVLGNGAC
jgi:hypothetical protein